MMYSHIVVDYDFDFEYLSRGTFVVVGYIWRVADDVCAFLEIVVADMNSVHYYLISCLGCVNEIVAHLHFYLHPDCLGFFESFSPYFASWCNLPFDHDYFH